jgi:hypothetical protein
MSPKEMQKQLVEELKAWCGPPGKHYGRRAEVANALKISRGLVGDWLAGRALPGWEIGLKLRAFLKKQRRREN